MGNLELPSNGVHKGSADGAMEFLGPAWPKPNDYTAADFRSDIVTKPTTGMLQAVLGASLADAFDESPSLLEEHIAAMTGNEDAVFCISGTMANQVALRTHSTQVQSPMGILCDRRCHILHKECGGIVTVGGALIQSIIPSNGVHLSLEDVKKSVVLTDDLYCTPTRILELENPHNGTIIPLDEFRAIARFARSHGIKVHLDGARMWEVPIAGAGTLADYCSEVDSVSMCFTKGLCAPVGSILVGSRPFAWQARKIRKTVGGSMRQPGINLAMVAAGLTEVFNDGGPNSLLRRNHAFTKELAECWESCGGKVLLPVQTNMIMLDLKAADTDREAWVSGGTKRGLKLRNHRLVVHCQIERSAVEILKEYMRETLGKAQDAHGKENDSVQNRTSTTSDTVPQPQLNKSQ